MSDRPEDEFPQGEGPQGSEPHEVKAQGENSRDVNSRDEGSRERRRKTARERNASGENPVRGDAPGDANSGQKNSGHGETPEEEVRWDERLSREIARREQQIREIWQRRTEHIDAVRGSTLAAKGLGYFAELMSWLGFGRGEKLRTGSQEYFYPKAEGIHSGDEKSRETRAPAGQRQSGIFGGGFSKGARHDDAAEEMATGSRQSSSEEEKHAGSEDLTSRLQSARDARDKKARSTNWHDSAESDIKEETANESATHEAHSGDVPGGSDEMHASDDWTRRGETRSAEHESEGHAWREVLGSDLSWGDQSRAAHEQREHDWQSDTALDAGGRSQNVESGPTARDSSAAGHESEGEGAAEEWHGETSGSKASDYFAELKSRLSFGRGASFGNLSRTERDENARPAEQEHSSAQAEKEGSGDKELSEIYAHARKWRGILQNTLLEDEGAAEARSESGETESGPRVPRVLIRIGGGKVFSRVAIVLLLLCSIAVGAAAGLLFVYSSDLPQIQELENYRPDVVTEVYADDGSSIGSFALQRRILLTYEQIPKQLRDAIISTEDRHFMDHWGIDFPRVAEAAWTDIMHRRVIQGASTITMQLAGGLFLNRADRSFRRKIEEAMLAVQIERHYTKQQIFTMYCNQVYLWNGNYGVEAASEFYFGKPVGELTLAQSALLAGMIRGPIYSPTSYPKRALERRNLVLDLMADNGAISRRDASAAKQTELGLNITYPQNNTLAPYYVEDIRQKLEAQFGTEAVHQEGLRVYSTLDARMQRDAVEALRDGLHAYDRRHGWRGNLPNIFHEHLGTLASYESPEWRHEIAPGDYVTGLIVAVDKHAAVAKIGPYRAVIAPADFAWTGTKDPEQLLQVGDLANLLIQSIDGSAAKVELEQVPAAQAALVAIDNATGEIKAMVGGYNFQSSKFNRAVQAMRQTGSSFKVYVYATAIEQGMSPFDTVVDEPVTYMVGRTPYSPHNYDERFEGRISLRRALADSRNVPAVRILQQVGIQNVIENARKFGISSPLPPYLPLALGAADLTLLEHTSAFSTFPDDGIHIQPHMIRRVTSYDGAILEETRPKVTDVIPPDVARTMTAMLEDVVNFGTGVRARALGRPSAGKTGTTNDFTDAWYIGFTPQITAGVWVGFDDPKSSLGKGETGARAALPIWLEFMEKASKGMPVESFPNVTPLEQLVKSANEQVDVPDTAPPADTTEQGIPAPAGKPNANPQKQIPPVAPIKPPDGTKPGKLGAAATPIASIAPKSTTRPATL